MPTIEFGVQCNMNNPELGFILGEKLVLIGKGGAQALDISSGSYLGYPKLASLSTWGGVPTSAAVSDYVATPPESSSKDAHMGKLVLRPSDSFPGRGAKLTGVTKIEDKIGADDNGNFYQIYSAETDT